MKKILGITYILNEFEKFSMKTPNFGFSAAFIREIIIA